MNPLNALGIRELTFLPVHFVKTIINTHDIDNVYSWVTNNLAGRFCIVRTPAIDNKKLKLTTFVAFENYSELTHFMLACPYTRR